ncbi:unknown protein [Bathycoccus prasinos]|uniref:Dolichyl-diphosphooligosaccharide--protein glycosyltransferase subunit 2 n=1 Tax=Bathycoccus prasinos TaxID=41875 RepID=K8EMH9_9CHLO|nr:unknown protein [Bathycoccus prasinos]CCO19194.1 unknown protein [Bathycoccus prasinos]|eukprot:XP_007509391.1 unknown protein [Bathycoccus prasinos]
MILRTFLTFISVLVFFFLTSSSSLSSSLSSSSSVFDVEKNVGDIDENGKPIVSLTITPAKRHLYDQFVKYDDVNGNLYILEDLEVDKRYELRASYSAKTPGKFSIVLLEGGEGKGEEEESESRLRRRSRKLLDVEKIAFKVSNYDESNSNEGTTRLFFSSSSSSKRRAYARVSVDSSNVVPTKGYRQFPQEGVTFNLTLEECFFFGLIPIHSIPAIALCVAMVAFGLLIGKPFAAFLWREDFTLWSSTNRRLKKT